MLTTDRFIRAPLHTALALTLSALLPLFIGCDGDSAETLVRNTGIDVTGLYQNGGAAITSNQTGSPTTQLDLRQNGDQLTATDNNGIIFKGTIGQVSGSDASYTLNGQTTVGQDVTITGNINVPESSNNGTMTGSWVEPSLFGSVAATAVVPTNDPDDGDNGDGDDGTGDDGTGDDGTGDDGTGDDGTGDDGTDDDGTDDGGSDDGGSDDDITTPPLP